MSFMYSLSWEIIVERRVAIDANNISSFIASKFVKKRKRETESINWNHDIAEDYSGSVRKRVSSSLIDNAARNPSEAILFPPRNGKKKLHKGSRARQPCNNYYRLAVTLIISSRWEEADSALGIAGGFSKFGCRMQIRKCIDAKRNERS